MQLGATNVDLESLEERERRSMLERMPLQEKVLELTKTVRAPGKLDKDYIINLPSPPRPKPIHATPLPDCDRDETRRGSATSASSLGTRGSPRQHRCEGDDSEACTPSERSLSRGRAQGTQLFQAGGETEHEEARVNSLLGNKIQVVQASPSRATAGETSRSMQLSRLGGSSTMRSTTSLPRSRSLRSQPIVNLPPFTVTTSLAALEQRRTHQSDQPSWSRTRTTSVTPYTEQKLIKERMIIESQIQEIDTMMTNLLKRKEALQQKLARLDELHGTTTEASPTALASPQQAQAQGQSRQQGRPSSASMSRPGQRSPTKAELLAMLAPEVAPLLMRTSKVAFTTTNTNMGTKTNVSDHTLVDPNPECHEARGENTQAQATESKEPEHSDSQLGSIDNVTIPSPKVAANEEEGNPESSGTSTSETPRDSKPKVEPLQITCRQVDTPPREVTTLGSPAVSNLTLGVSAQRNNAAPSERNSSSTEDEKFMTPMPLTTSALGDAIDLEALQKHVPLAPLDAATASDVAQPSDEATSTKRQTRRWSTQPIVLRGSRKSPSEASSNPTSEPQQGDNNSR